MNYFSHEIPLLSNLPKLSGQPLALYLHFPFCLKKCDYCAFYSIIYDETKVDEWVKSILASLSHFLAQLQPDNIISLYIGGGTPSLIPPPQLKALFQGIRDVCQKEKVTFHPVELSVEANPGTLTDEWITTASECGINRLTMGIQSFSPQLRQLIGRSGDSFPADSRLRDQIALIKSLDMKIGLDLITGIPTQTEQIACHDIEIATTLGVEHISLYRLTPEEATPFWKRIDQLSNEEAQDDVELAAQEFLQKKGYPQYEVSNFAKQGFESIHNHIYWAMDNSLGLGVSGVSTLHNYDCSPPRRENPKAIRLKELPNHQFETEHLTPSDLLIENIMMGLRVSRGIDPKKFIHRFESSPQHLFPKSCQKAQEKKWLIVTEREFKMSPKGLLFLNSFLVDILSELDEHQGF